MVQKQPLLLNVQRSTLPELAFSNKGALVLADVLAHRWSRCMDSLLSTSIATDLQKHFGILPNAQTIAVTDLTARHERYMFAMLEKVN